jgi:hypothetical protein
MNENTDKIISIKRIEPETFESVQFIPPNYSDNETEVTEVTETEIKVTEIKVTELETKPNKKIIKKKKESKESKDSIYDEFLIATENKQVIEEIQVNEVIEPIKSIPRVNKYKKRCN